LSDWIQVTTPKTRIEYDFQGNPLQIKTNQTLDNKGTVKIWLFHDEASGSMAGLRIHHYSPSSPWRYFIGDCGEFTPFPGVVPTEPDKTWTFSRTTQGWRIECNGAELLDFELSEGACGADWSQKWERKIKYIKFDAKQNDAADFYRPKSGRQQF